MSSPSVPLPPGPAAAGPTGPIEEHYKVTVDKKGIGTMYIGGAEVAVRRDGAKITNPAELESIAKLFSKTLEKRAIDSGDRWTLTDKGVDVYESGAAAGKVGYKDKTMTDATFGTKYAKYQERAISRNEMQSGLKEIAKKYDKETFKSALNKIVSHGGDHSYSRALQQKENEAVFQSVLHTLRYPPKDKKFGKGDSEEACLQEMLSALKENMYPGSLTSSMPSELDMASKPLTQRIPGVKSGLEDFFKDDLKIKTKGEETKFFTDNLGLQCSLGDLDLDKDVEVKDPAKGPPKTRLVMIDERISEDRDKILSTAHPLKQADKDFLLQEISVLNEVKAAWGQREAAKSTSKATAATAAAAAAAAPATPPTPSTPAAATPAAVPSGGPPPPPPGPPGGGPPGPPPGVGLTPPGGPPPPPPPGGPPPPGPPPGVPTGGPPPTTGGPPPGGVPPLGGPPPLPPVPPPVVGTQPQPLPQPPPQRAASSTPPTPTPLGAVGTPPPADEPPPRPPPSTLDPRRTAGIIDVTLNPTNPAARAPAPGRSPPTAQSAGRPAKIDLEAPIVGDKAAKSVQVHEATFAELKKIFDTDMAFSGFRDLVAVKNRMKELETKFDEKQFTELKAVMIGFNNLKSDKQFAFIGNVYEAKDFDKLREGLKNI